MERLTEVTIEEINKSMNQKEIQDAKIDVCKGGMIGLFFGVMLIIVFCQ